MSFLSEVTKTKKNMAEVKAPSSMKVVMHNDDYTPMEFVVAVLEKFFHMERSKAANTMVEVHTKGKAICGAYTMDVALTKIEQVIEYARNFEHPLLCSVEAI